MLVRFRGTRGSIATPGPSTIRYGGNTSCVEIVTGSGKRFICDCGTGARRLGASLLRNEAKPIDATILLTHTHWDHIQGFPFFAPVFIPGNRIAVCGPQGARASLPEVLAGQMEYTYFPVDLSQLGARLEYIDLTEGPNDVGGVRISAQFLNHPAVALGCRIETEGLSVLYLCDHEPYWGPLWRSDDESRSTESILHEGDRRHAAFMQNADAAIHDAQYTPEEYPAKKNWGHSTWTYVTRMAAAAKVKRLFLTHHDPAPDDDFLDRVERQASELAASLGSPMRVSCSREGFEEAFDGFSGTGPRTNAVAQAERLPATPLTVLVVDDDEDLRILAERALTRAGHRVLLAAGGEEGLAILNDPLERPDVLVLDLYMPAPDGFEVLRRLKGNASPVAVVVLTAWDDEESIRRSFELGATDFLNKPFTPPQLDARVRSCFARSDRQERAWRTCANRIK